jgi:hypothetical protein
MATKFKIGQPVFYDRMRATGRYIVFAVLPPQLDGEVHYQIRSENNPSRKYTASGSHLRSATWPLERK